GEDGVEGLDDGCLGQGLLNLFCGRLTGFGDEAGEFGVDGVGGVDDGLAGEAVEGRGDVGDGGVGNGEGDDRALDLVADAADGDVVTEFAGEGASLLFVANEKLHAVSCGECACGDAARDIACSDDG